MLDQYGHCENLEFHGVPVQQNEDIVQMIQKLLQLINYDLDKQYVSTCNRLTRKRTDSPSPIIIKFTNRMLEISFMQREPNLLE